MFKFWISTKFVKKKNANQSFPGHSRTCKAISLFFTGQLGKKFKANFRKREVYVSGSRVAAISILLTTSMDFVVFRHYTYKEETNTIETTFILTENTIVLKQNLECKINVLSLIFICFFFLSEFLFEFFSFDFLIVFSSYPLFISLYYWRLLLFFLLELSCWEPSIKDVGSWRGEEVNRGGGQPSKDDCIEKNIYFHFAIVIWNTFCPLKI